MLRRPSPCFDVQALDSRRLLAYSAAAALINQDDAISNFPGITGQGVTVAVIDTGVDYTQASLGGAIGAGHKVIGGYDFLDNDSDPMDETGHGTAVAAAIAAETYTTGGITYQGIAPDARLVALRAGDDSGFADSDIQEALQWVIDNHEAFDIKVINLSLGAGNYADSRTSSTYSDEFAELRELGILVVAASGNSNDANTGPISEDGIAYPAADPNVLAVGAVSASDVISSWTQRGDELDLLAPGVDLVLPKLGGGYETVRGTSFASPIVAGAAALVYQALAGAGAGDVGSILMSSGTNNRDGAGETGNTTTLQFARLDIDAGLRLALGRADAQAAPDFGGVFDTALDSQGVTHAAYYDEGALKYATRSTAGVWSSSVVVDAAGDVGHYASIAVDLTGKAGIAYYDGTNTALKYAGFNGTSWTTTFVDSKKLVGTFPSLAFDIDGNAYISYYRKSVGYLKLAILDRDTGAWSTNIVDSGNVGTWTSIAVGEAPISASGFFTTYDTTVAIAYADAANGNLKYARLDLDDAAATWYVATVDDLDAVAHIDLKLHAGPTASTLQAQIAYQDAGAADVKYAYKTGANTWVTETVAGTGRLGDSVQLTFNETDDPTVIYFDRNRKLLYSAARGSAGVWSSGRFATSSGPASVALNDRTGDSVTSWLNRPKNGVFSVQTVV